LVLDRVTHPVWLSNSWLLADREGGSAVVVDCGGPVEPLLAMVRSWRVGVTHLLLTHHHHDHTAGAAAVARATGARVCAHRLEAPLIRDVDQVLEDGDAIASGDLRIKVLHIPGHTAGQAAFLAGGALCFTGDTLFRGSVGSTTAPGHTTFADLRRSLVDRLLALPDAVRIAPGHAEPTTLGEERSGNPFLRVMLGLSPEGSGTARYAGREVRLVVWARDYDGGHKAWIRFPGGEEATVPGSRVDAGGRDRL
jgi:glyoxylase-like metal-dependent hydrolase (beta-lactamase superfamily II)